jgi:hypothetical protein
MAETRFTLTSEQVRAARALLRWEQRDLAEASSVSLPSIKRLELRPGIMAAHESTLAALKGALERGGVEFTNGDQPGVRLTKAAAARAAKSPTSTAASKAARSKSGKATKPK